MFNLVNVTKEYRAKHTKGGQGKDTFKRALDNVSLTIGEGETVAILGPNGAGKSTLCKIAAGMAKPTTGTASLDGIDITSAIRQVSTKIGYVMGPTLVYHRLKALHYLEFFAKVYDVPSAPTRILEVAHMVGLRNRLNDVIESYSTGMKMRLSLARALLHDPPFLILDEFTMGMDVVAAIQVRRMVREAHKTVLLTTHNTYEAEMMADKVVFLSNGKVVAMNTMSNLVGENEIRFKIRLSDSSYLKEQIPSTVRFQESGEGMFELWVPQGDISAVLGVLSHSSLSDFQVSRPSLNEAYLRLTGDKLVDLDP